MSRFVPQPLPPHGTRARYVHRTRPCREACCRRANADYIARYRLRKAAMS